MVFRANAIQAGWHFDQDDAIIDNSSLDSTYSNNRNENPTKNAIATQTRKISKKNTSTSNNNEHTDEEGWTTTTPGRTKPKNINKGSSTESIITTIEGNFEKYETGTPNKISVRSPSRKHKCNIPETTRIVSTDNNEFVPCITKQTENTGKAKERSNSRQENEEDKINNNMNKEKENKKTRQEKAEENIHKDKDRQEYRREENGEQRQQENGEQRQQEY